MESFLVCSIGRLLRKNISVVFSGKKFLVDPENGAKYGGEFDEFDKTLKVATGIPVHKWFPVYIHEYCHFLQFSAKTKAWLNSSESLQRIFENISVKTQGRGHTETKGSKRGFTKKDVLNVMRMEMEAERLVLKIIDEHKIETDRDKYVKGANAYMLYYSISVYKFSAWPAKSLYRNEKFLNMMPSKKIMPITWFFEQPDQVKKFFL